MAGPHIIVSIELLRMVLLQTRLYLGRQLSSREATRRFELRDCCFFSVNMWLLPCMIFVQTADGLSNLGFRDNV